MTVTMQGKNVSFSGVCTLFLKFWPVPDCIHDQGSIHPVHEETVTDLGFSYGKRFSLEERMNGDRATSCSSKL